jgi:hypothetical protein
MEPDIQALRAECAKQEESCLYTSTAIFEWLKSLRTLRIVFVVAPVILGGIASWRVLSVDPTNAGFIATCALLAGLFPAIYKALGFDMDLRLLAAHGHTYKVLQDRFRQLRTAGPLEDRAAFRAEFSHLMDRMDKAREASITPPERYFKSAQRKIKAGDYDFKVDAQSKDSK